MPAALHFYVDDSGTRHPDRASTSGSGTRDWFALGGVLVKDTDEGECRTAYEAFCTKWGIQYPLHSADIRHASNSFGWLHAVEEKERERFMRELTELLLRIPAVGLACVIDRPGYNERYGKKYGRQKWSLCKTAFSIVLERAAKHAATSKRKLRTYVERCSKSDDNKLKQYFANLKKTGHPFDQRNSEKYSPLSKEEHASLLYDLKFKKKTSPMVQIADLYLWPICMGGYHLSNRPYAMLKEAGKLIDVVCDQARVGELGTKYSCFDLVKRQP